MKESDTYGKNKCIYACEYLKKKFWVSGAKLDLFIKNSQFFSKNAKMKAICITAGLCRRGSAECRPSAETQTSTKFNFSLLNFIN